MKLKKVLVIEDSELLQKMYGLILPSLGDAGSEVLRAYNGHQGLELLAANPDTELVILDINMPVMTGLEFLQKMKAQEVFRSIPVIIVSTEGKEADTIRGLRAGARAYLTKPFQAEDLRALIERVFAAGPAHAAEAGAR